MLVKCQRFVGESGNINYPSVMKLNTMTLLFRIRTCKIQYRKELTIRIVDRQKYSPSEECPDFRQSSREVWGPTTIEVHLEIIKGHIP